VTSALVGIGLNVEAAPQVPPTLFVPRTAALKRYAPDPVTCTHGRVFRRLVSRLAENYRKCLDGKFSEILEVYRKRSVVIGRKVTVYEDDEIELSSEIVSGRVTSIGDNLELRLEGSETPVWSGRLVLSNPDDVH
jgi:biotin-(acetyl-CoA carboxylase) ligase